MSRDGQVKLADFGLARIYDFSSLLTTVVSIWSSDWRWRVTNLLPAGGDTLVQEPGDSPRYNIRHPSGHLELRLYPGGALPQEAALPRPVRDRPAGQDIRHPRDPLRGRVAQGLLRPEGGLLSQELPGPRVSLPRHGTSGFRFIKGKRPA